MTRQTKIFLIVIFLLAAVIRIGYFFVFQPPLNWQDCRTFHITAQNIIAGKGYSLDGINPFIAREPGYSTFFLAPLYLIFGPSVNAGLALNLVLTLLIIYFIFRLAKRYFSERIGLLAGLFLAIYPPLVAFSGELLSEIPFTFLLLLSVILIIKAAEKKSAFWVFIGGLFLGAAILTKSYATFLPIFLIPFLYLGLGKKFKKTIQYFLLICFGVLILITPYIIRNYLAFGQFVYGRDDSGLNLWAGSYLPWDGEFRGNNVFPLPELTKDMDSFSADKKLRDLAVENIRNNPFGVLKIWLKKPARMLFNPEFNSVLERENRFAEYSEQGILNPNIIKIGLVLINILIIALAFFGAFFVQKYNPLIGSLLILIVVYFLIILLPFSPDSRYKLPLMPYLMILASVGTSVIFHRFSHKSTD